MKSARFIAQELVNYTVKDVYDIWKDMGLVEIDAFGDWVITEFGRNIGGRMSKGSCRSVPVFDSDKVIDMMIDFCKKMKGE